MPVKLQLYFVLVIDLVTITPGVVHASDSSSTRKGVAHASPASASPDINIEPLHPVEAGAGGEIKPERSYRTVAERLFEWHGHLLWESRYVTEGRDNLSGDAMTSVSSEFTLNGLSIVPWFASSPVANYKEIDLNIVYSHTLSETLEMYLGYTGIITDDKTSHARDNELSFDLAYDWNKRLSTLASMYYSFDAAGSFLTLVTKYIHPVDGSMHFNAQAIIGANAGYISDGHSGVNYIQALLSFANEFSDRLEIYTYAAYNRAINRNAVAYAGDVLLDNFVWGGLGATYRF